MKKQVFIMLFAIAFVAVACTNKEGNKSQHTEDTVAEAGESDTYETEVITSENNKDETDTDDGIKEEKESAAFKMLAEWEDTYRPVFVDELTEELDKEGLHYVGYYNESDERLDVTLEDGTSLLFLKITDLDMNELGYELIMKDGVINAGSFLESYLHCYDVIMDDSYFPETSDGLVAKEELWKYDRTDLSIMRNEIYARYGRMFEDPFLKAVFSLKSWYEPKYTAQEFAELEQELLTEIDKKNLQMIIQHEIDCGYRKKSEDTSERVQALLSGSWIDLDGDGTKEQVVYQKTEIGEYGEIYSATLRILRDKEEGMDSGSDVSITSKGCNLHDDLYILTMNNQIFYPVIGDYGPSADDSLIIYEYKSGKLEEVGQMYDNPQYIKIYPDKIETSERADHIHSQFVTFTYVFENGKFLKQKEDYYEYDPKVVKVIQEYNYYKEKDLAGEAFSLTVGEEIMILGGDQKEWVRFQKVSTKEEGWIYVVEPGKCRLPDGSEAYSDQVFEGLDFFG